MTDESREGEGEIACDASMIGTIERANHDRHVSVRAVDRFPTDIVG